MTIRNFSIVLSKARKPDSQRHMSTHHAWGKYFLNQEARTPYESTLTVTIFGVSQSKAIPKQRYEDEINATATEKGVVSVNEERMDGSVYLSYPTEILVLARDRVVLATVAAILKEWGTSQDAQDAA